MTASDQSSTDSEAGGSADREGSSEIDDRPPISPSQLGQFTSLGNCPQFFAYEFENAGEAERSRDWKEAFEPLSPLFAADGEAFERRCVAALRERAAVFYDHTAIDEWEESEAELRAVLREVRSADTTEPIVTTQTRLGTEIEAWPIAGDADFLVFWPRENGFRVRVLDAKAAHEEKSYQQLQVAAYTLLLRAFLSDLPLDRDWTVSGGVLTREYEFTSTLTPETLPSFDLGPRETDVRRLLVSGGAFDRHLASDDSTYQLAPKCGGCAYKEACYTNAIEARSTALLGLTRGEQALLADAGIETISDLAALCHLPTDPRPYQYTRPDPAPARKETYERLTNASGLGERLPTYVQRAQSMLGAFDPDDLYARPEREVPWLLGAGASTLPDDDPHPSFPDPTIERGSLIRVYLNVQHDSRRDRLTMASAYVTSSKFADAGCDPETVSSFVPRVPEPDAEARAVEREVLTDFLASLFKSIRTVARRTGLGERAPLHWYFYTRGERETLIEALKRHRDADGARALRDLLGLDGAITDVGAKQTSEHEPTDERTGEQSMVSIVAEEFRRRKASRTPNDGLIAVIEELTPREDAMRFSDWTHHRDGREIDLREAFRHRFFDCWVPYDGIDGGFELLADDGDPDGYYPSRVRRGAQIPLEYVWAVAGKLTTEWVTEFATDGPAADSDTESDPDADVSADSMADTATDTRTSYVQTGLFDPIGSDHSDGSGEADESDTSGTDDEETDGGNGNDANDVEIDGRVAPFRWLDGDERTERITPADIEALGRALARCVAHVERGLRYRNPRIEKRPIDLTELDTFSLGETDLRRAATDFLDLEYDTARQDVYRHYAMPVEGRLRTGRSVVAVVREVEETESGLRMTGDLNYDRWFDDPERIARSCRISGADGGTGGSWLVANGLDRYGNPDHTAPYDIERGVPVTVEEIDPVGGTVTLSALDTYFAADDYRVRHRRFATDPEEANDWTPLVAEGTAFVLDPQTDDVTGQHVLDTLAADSSHETGYLASVLEAVIAGERDMPKTDAFDAESVETFCEWASGASALGGRPNEKQAAFVRETRTQVSLLQGPPGTGKTSGALALAILARVGAFEADGRDLSGVILGESHKSVDEVLADVAEVYETYRADPDAPERVDDLRLVRLASEPDDPVPGIEYLDYHDPAHEERLREIGARLLDGQRGRVSQPQRTFADLGNEDDGERADGTEAGARTDAAGTDVTDKSSSDSSTASHTLVFATPGRLYGLLRRLGGMDGPKPEEWLALGTSFFDLLAVDEASMTRLPTLLFAGAFVHEHAQVLVAGDHRQMPPVRVHDWERETRRTIEEYAPHCSALDFFRLLRCEPIGASRTSSSLPDGGVETTGASEASETAVVRPDVPAVDFEETLVTAGASLDIVGLETTYRCHDAVSSFLERYVYRHDGIPYESAADHPDFAASGSSAGVACVLDGIPITLVLHDETESQQANPTEAALTAAIAADLDGAGIGAGVVTPHNAQKGLLRSIVGSGIEVDTVERFQGGERDAIVVSATVSDPDFLDTERDFLLNPNRLTVAMSRMQRKLIVVASRSIFDLVPPDTEGYERARLWKGLYEDAGVLDREADWAGTVGEFVRDSSSENGDATADGTDADVGAGADSGVVADTGVEVYSFGAPSSDPSEWP